MRPREDTIGASEGSDFLGSSAVRGITSLSLFDPSSISEGDRTGVTGVVIVQEWLGIGCVGSTLNTVPLSAKDKDEI